jgi:hypothetical protein
VDNLVDELVDKPPSRYSGRGLRCPSSRPSGIYVRAGRGEIRTVVRRVG